jgi:hypothetical protein
MKNVCSTLLVIAGLTVGLSACQKQENGAGGTAEAVGEKIDAAVEKAKPALEGAAEKTGEALKKAGEKTGEVLQSAGEKTGAAMEQGGKKLEGESKEAQQEK